MMGTIEELKWLNGLIQEARTTAPIPKPLGHLSRKYYRQPQVSKRRWKARCKLGRLIPRWAMINYSLHKWFEFELTDINTAYYRATPSRGEPR